MAQPLSSVSFSESVYALSKVVHIVKFRNDIALKLSEHQRKHLRLLDDIALLLVTESNSDVAAVSLERLSSELHFHYAKNRPTTQDEKAHIDALLADLRSPGTPNQRIEKMLRKVMVVCRPKMLSRLRKLKFTVLDNQAGDRPFLRGDRGGELHSYFRSTFGDWYAVYPTAAEFLDEFLLHINSWKPAESEPEEMFELLRMAHVAGSYKPVRSPHAAASDKAPESMFIDPMLGQRMRLLGDYFGAVKQIVKHFDSAAAHQPGEMTIHFHEAPITAQVEVAMPKDYLTILNRYAIDKHLPTVTYDTLATAYPHRTHAPTGVKPSHPVLQSVHAECTLAVYLASLGRPWTNVEIGCSKGSCWLCESYLSHRQAGLAFHVRNAHGKLQPGWTMPQGGDPMVEQFLRRLVEDEVVEVLHKAHNAKRGDTQPRSESDEEEKNTELIGKPSWSRR